MQILFGCVMRPYRSHYTTNGICYYLVSYTLRLLCRKICQTRFSGIRSIALIIVLLAMCEFVGCDNR